MKNQYFADRHDFYKYDLCFELMRSVAGLERFVFAAMLTPDDASSDGAFTEYAPGTRDPALHVFLLGCLARQERDVRHLAAFCREQFAWRYDPVLAPLLERESDLVTYFSAVLERPLADALVLLDPDNGLLVPSARGNRRCKYASCEQVARVYAACDPASVLVLFQHAARRPWPAQLEELGSRLKEDSGIDHLSCIAPDGLVAYFVAGKTATQGQRVAEVLGAYAERHSCKHLLEL